MNVNLDINQFINEFSSCCSKIQIKEFFNKDEIITTYIQKRNQICILLEGNADLVRYEFNGNKTIIEHFSSNDIFGELFYTISNNNELFVEAKGYCKILFFIYDDIKNKCKNTCEFHEKLVSYLPEIILSKVVDLNTRIELLTKRSIREKLLGYFNILSTRNFSKTFTLTYSLTDLADYLSVDRSAMMRELKILKEEGFIKKNNNKITLLYK